MSDRRNTRLRQARRAVRLDFAAIEIVGALLTPDIVAKIAAFQASDQTEGAYRVPPGLKLRDEIARYYRIAEALWAQFSAGRGSGPGAVERFVLDLLRQCFGFDTIKPQKTLVRGERQFPIRHAALDGRVPIVIAPAAAEDARRSGLDESLAQFGEGARRRSATLLLQEYLNGEGEALWGLASDGLTLRLMRDNVSLTRPAWIEANLAKMFGEGLFADFSALWLLIHQTRFGAPSAALSDCALERWRERGRTEGVAARDKLRLGVEAALAELGQGFIEYQNNTPLRQALADGKLAVQGYYEELLRLVYRLIFLFAAEDRGLLHPAEATEEARRTYAEGYSVARLRERSMRRTAWDRHGDAWEGLKASFAALGRGEPKLGLPALGGLFARGLLPHLEDCRIENRRFLAAIWRLAWLRPEGQPLTRVNWRDMETEELGSVYESLLELTPRASADARTFDFAEAAEGRGNVRKTSGSYYTPPPLVKLLLDSTLDPVLDAAEARNPDDPAAEILALSIIDPACGSGHFLLAAARRAAARIAKVRSPGVPSQAEFQHALREVVAHCIYGVDRNPLAVELCKVALWIEALEPGKPLTFLDSHVRCGDSLIGVFDYEALKRGIPDEAYKPLTGDDKETAKGYARHNKQQREGKGATGFLKEFQPPAALVEQAREILEMPEDTLAEIEAKRAAFVRLHSGAWTALKTACDSYVVAFFVSKIGGAPTRETLAKPSIPLTDDVWKAARGQNVYGPLVARVDEIAQQVRAFHWPIEFPHVFTRGGFDAVIGNPPWERIKLQEQEFFAARSPEIANAPNKAARDKLIKALEKSSPESPEERLLADFRFTKRIAEAASEFARNSGRYPLTGTGDVNTYALFAEHFSRLARAEGRAGVIVPTGIATDSSTSAFFGNLVQNKRLALLIDFENRARIFPAVDSRMKFAVLAMGAAKSAEFAFFLTNPAQLDEKERRFALSAETIARINPNTRTAPVFRSRADAELTTKIYARVPVLIEEKPAAEGGDVNPWGASFHTRIWHMAEDSQWFSTAADLERKGWERSGPNWHQSSRVMVPLYEAKMIHHFDHRWATYGGASAEDQDGARDVTMAEKRDPAFEPSPRYWVSEAEVQLRAARVPAGLKRAYRESDPGRCLKALAEWVAGQAAAERRKLLENDLARVLGRGHNWRAALGVTLDRFLHDPKTLASGAEAQRETPLTAEDIRFLAEGPNDPLALTAALIERKQPRWLMGWRDICRSTDERTVIASVFPRSASSDTLLLIFLNVQGAYAAALNACLCSMTLDYVCRQKIGGTHLKTNLFKQNAIIPPESYSASDLGFIVPRVIELTYTSFAMRPWAEDLGHAGPPFAWDENRRALLRAELDAFFARKYGLTRDDLRYILDPADVKGADYPSETFRVLKEKELARFNGRYRTRDLTLAAWDRWAQAQIGDRTIEVRRPSVRVPASPDGAWSRGQPQPGDTGAALTAVLKALDGPRPIRDIRLAVALILEPRLFVPLLPKQQASEWRRLVGAEADPLKGNVTGFVPRADSHWGSSVRNHRGNGRLVEDLREGTWAPGPGLDAIDTAGWPDGRAGFVLDALNRLDLATARSSLPAEIQRWVDAAAA